MEVMFGDLCSTLECMNPIIYLIFRKCLQDMSSVVKLNSERCSRTAGNIWVVGGDRLDFLLLNETS